MNATFAATQPREQQLADMGVALTTRAIENSGLRHDRVDRHKPRPQGEDWRAFYNMPIIDFCRDCLIVDGKDEQLTKRAPADACYRAAFGFQTREFGAAYHVSATLPALLFDAFNKSLDAGYEEANSTWEQVFSRGEPAKDFKDMHRIKMGEIPSLPFWGNNQDPSVAGVADEKVTYAVEARALSVDYSYRSAINDDLGALARVTAALGASAKRTVNAVAYAVFTSQPTLPDGQPPWSAVTGQRYRSNLTTGVAIPDVATLNVMRTKMRLLRGLNTPEVMRAMPSLQWTRHAYLSRLAWPRTHNKPSNRRLTRMVRMKTSTIRSLVWSGWWSRASTLIPRPRSTCLSIL